MPRAQLDIQNHIATVTLTRSDKMNAVDTDMIQALLEIGEQLKSTPARAVVLHGEGRAFCAGTDVSKFEGGAELAPADRLLPRSHGARNMYQQVALIWRDLPMPVIAALHGVAFGAGLQIALGADMRIAHPDTKLSIMEMKWGLVPDMGGMALFSRLVRSDILRRLIYTHEIFDARAGLDWGFVTELNNDPLARAQELAEFMAQKSPSALRAAKSLIALADQGNIDQADILMAESQAQAGLIGGADQRAVIAANLAAPRPPKT